MHRGRCEHAHLLFLLLRLSKRPKHRSSDPNTPQSLGYGSYPRQADSKTWLPAQRTPSRQSFRASAKIARRNRQPEGKAANNRCIGGPFESTMSHLTDDPLLVLALLFF